MTTLLGAGPTQFFYDLNPEAVIDAVDNLGLEPTGRCLMLNSMENRVYELECEDGRFLVAKFYRPGRWSKAQIQEEHDFLFDLNEDEIPAICPLKFDNESVLFDEKTQLLFALFPKVGGRHFEYEVPMSLERLGSALARLHQTGRRREFKNRPILKPLQVIQAANSIIIQSEFVNDSYKKEYTALLGLIEKLSSPIFETLTFQRVHGDSHAGNILFRESIFIVDFDDAMMAPTMQDFWMLISGDDEEFQAKRNRIAEGYEIFMPYPYEQERAIEILRAMRMIHYQSWIQKRYQDPSFIHHFPYFKDQEFWQSHLFDLYQQRERIEDQLNPY
jgi:Ser/Thr protein kinase RdoA (MazF antagonist)